MAKSEGAAAPRAFISYAWTSPTHQTWVLNLATRLREDGVDVLLDKWDLKPGHDAHVFMEQMVLDPKVTKVIMVCDRKYTEKANDRSGGVGIESQIISPEIYASAAQDKYAAAITENDEKGNAYVPVFYKGRIYFDFTDSDNHEREYESLLRWILDKPLHVKPELGAVPEHISQPAAVAAATVSKLRRAEEAIRQGARTARAFTRDFIETFVSELRERGALLSADGVWDEQVMASLDRMRPYIAQFQDLTRTVARFSDDPDLFDEHLQGVESAGVLMFRPPEVNSWTEHQFDHYRLALWEIFLTMTAILLKERRFDLVLQAVQKAYLIPNKDSTDRATADYTEFFHGIPTLHERNKRLGLNRAAPEADVLAEHYKAGNLSLHDLMQADFILYLRSVGISTEWGRWFPVTLVFANRHQPFEVFARAESLKYFEKLSPLLGVTSVDELKATLKGVNERRELRIGMWPTEVFHLANAENLGKTA
jgi:hypothetical protein